MAGYTLLGPGTVKLGPTETATDFSGEVVGAKILHTYEESGEARKMLDGTDRPTSRTRTDGFSASIENDLTAAGLYQFLVTNDLDQVQLQFTPNTAAGAKWVGTVVLALPGEIGTDKFGNPIVSDVSWGGVGVFTFTPAT